MLGIYDPPIKGDVDSMTPSIRGGLESMTPPYRSGFGILDPPLISSPLVIINDTPLFWSAVGMTHVLRCTLVMGCTNYSENFTPCFRL